MGEIFGKYELVKKIAVGGMAEIFLAQQSGPEGFSKKVAIKRILPHLTEDGDFVAMFLDEARLVARFSHPNIVQIFELGQVGNVYFLAMEYVNGSSMSKVLKACQSKMIAFPPIYGARICSLAAEGLEYAHNFTDPDGTPLNLIHRDVSPQNIMLSYEGAVKLLDFGIAKAAANVYKTRSTSLKGKAAYMSPEQITMKTGLDRRSDIFSLGIVLYEFVTGKRPFQGETELDLMMAIVREPPRDPREYVPDLPRELVDILMTALRKDRRQRYQSAREMQQDLEKFLVGRKAVIDSFVLGSFLRQVMPPSESPMPGGGARTPSKPLPQLATEQPDQAPAAAAGTPVRKTPTHKSSPALVRPATGDDAPTVFTPSSPRKATELAAAAENFGVQLPAAPAAQRSTGDWRRLALLLLIMLLVLAGGATAAFLIFGGGEKAPTPTDAGSLEVAVRAPPQVENWPAPVVDAEANKTANNAAQGANTEGGVDAANAAGKEQTAGSSAAATEQRPGEVINSEGSKAAEEHKTAMVKSPKKGKAAAARKENGVSPVAEKAEKESAQKEKPEKAVAVVTPQAKGKLLVDSKPWVEVKIDGVSYGITPWKEPVDLDAGIHLVELKNPEGILHREKVQISAGKETELRKKFQKGFLQVLVKPFGEVYINGVKKGVTPLDAPLELWEGSVTLRVYCKDTGKEFTKQVQIKGGQTTEEKIDLR